MADSRTPGESSSAIVRLVFGVVGLLATVWIPTLAFLLGLAAIALGYVGWRGSSLGVRSLATVAMCSALLSWFFARRSSCLRLDRPVVRA